MDPLRPFATLISSLRTIGKASKTEHAASGSSQRSADPNVARSDAIGRLGSIQARLGQRLANLGDWSTPRAREIFVECILVAELGEDLAKDPGFFDLVHKVSENISDQPKVSDRLDQLLRDLRTAQRQPGI